MVVCPWALSRVGGRKWGRLQALPQTVMRQEPQATDSLYALPETDQVIVELRVVLSVKLEQQANTRINRWNIHAGALPGRSASRTTSALVDDKRLVPAI